MKYLNQFSVFDLDKFLNGKKLVVTGCAPLKDNDTGKVLGTRVSTVIFADNTEYKHKDGETGSNRFEKLNIKVSKGCLRLLLSTENISLDLSLHYSILPF